MDIKKLTVGIEEEYQVINPETGELTSYIAEFLERDAVLFKDSMVPEFLQSQLEVTSKVCKNIKQARKEVIRLRKIASKFAQETNCNIIAAGTHPYSRWEDQVRTDKERYRGLYDSMQFVAKRLLIFGMHIHIGIPDRDLRIDVMNQMRYFVPHILSLSTSSPFWQGEDTGFKSYRGIVFEDLPRTGIPEKFSSAKSYDKFVNQLMETKCIDNPSKIWWDIRPHSKFPTVEFRMCDSTTKVDEVIASSRGIPIGEDSISPGRHPEIENVESLLNFITYVRDISGKPTGIKCVIGQSEWLDDMCHQILKKGLKYAPDFITVDSGDGGSGAAPMSLIDHMGLPIKRSLPLVVDKLTEFNLRSRVKVIASGSIEKAVKLKGIKLTKGAKEAVTMAGGKILD